MEGAELAPMCLRACMQGGGGGGESAALRAQLAELARDNGILKRAVAIQNARLQVAYQVLLIVGLFVQTNLSAPLFMPAALSFRCRMSAACMRAAKGAIESKVRQRGVCSEAAPTMHETCMAADPRVRVRA